MGATTVQPKDSDSVNAKKKMDIPIEDTNLGGIGSDEDKAAREAAARMEFQWDAGTGGREGVQIWRVENARTESGAPHFGINAWPKEKYGQVRVVDCFDATRASNLDACRFFRSS